MIKYYREKCNSIFKAILESFEISGYLKGEELNNYISELVRIDFQKKENKEEYYDFILNKLTKDKTYLEFLNNNVKICPYCGIVKPLSSFYSSLSKNKHSSRCKICSPKALKHYREERYKNLDAEGRRMLLYTNRSYKAKYYISKKIERNLTESEILKIRELIIHKNMTPNSILNSGIIKIANKI
ncbi:TPA: hypothetical protein KNT04_002669 [Clostridioides difficile]|nr:hypothetical protein [Clostridioides difficile]